ncbi:MAG: LysM peptidoglycan-binding domain-containing protein [Ktedonobacteraceae bacterium]
MKKALVAVITFLAGVLFFISSPPVYAQSNTVAFLAWYMYPITKPYNGSTEFGEDLGTPQGTPITSLVSGQLVGAGFYGGGGVVTVKTTLNGAPADFYVQHLDSIVNVSLCQYGNCGGQYVTRGELLGYSGGECNWRYGPGFGKFNACANHFSNGPHIEIGINPPYYGIWGTSPHPGPNYNPYSTFVALINGGTMTYVVKAGDTLASIGRKYKLSWSQIYKLNASVIGPNPNRLYAGEKLRIPLQVARK